MKNITLMLVLICIRASGYGQSASPEKPAVIEPHPLSVTCLKTTTLVFPFAIKSVDRGSPDVLAQKAKGVENVLWVKAARKEMEQGSLTVITADGKLYSYLVEYNPNPAVLTLRYPSTEPAAGSQAAAFPGAAPNEAWLKALAEKVAKKQIRSRGRKAKNNGTSLRLEGLFINGDVLFCRVRLHNKTQVGYNFDTFRFTVCDKKQPRRTASQQRETKPILIHNGTAVVKGQSSQAMVFALPRFTIPDGKYLAVEVMEKNGGRHLTLRIKGKTILRATPVGL